MNDMVPEPIKDFVGESNSSTIYGIYDCHDSIDEYEVGVSAAVIDDGITVEGSTGGVSTCTALYNFEECQSCTLDCGADLANLDINSFKADCSNVVLENPVEGACMVDCGYQTSGCFPSGSSSGSRITGVTAATLSLMLAGAFFYH